MKALQNPVLRGFHPDPSIVRVGEDYYLATSTFEWFPGVAVYHSKDLVHWRFAAFPLTRTSQLDLRGVPSSCGVFAPCLSWSDGLFYLIYTVVKTESVFQDTDNYLVTAPDIQGPWSEPVYLNSTGFDPSLFHDADGRKWLVNRDCDTRLYQEPRGGILLREYDPVQKRLVGPERRIYRSEKIIGAEGPHLYRRGSYYYLLLAEGGTDTNHVATVARSRSLFGPYECDPETPLLTSRDDPWNPLQKAGHASLVETQTGQWYIAHLVGRPLPHKGTCILGRETALQQVEWTEDGWLRLAGGGREPRLTVPAPDLPESPAETLPERDDFDRETLGYPYQTLRIPLSGDVLSLTERPGFLRLHGRDSLHSKYEQALVARRQQDFCFHAETTVEFEPKNYHQMAGLILLYDTESFYYLYLTRDEAGRKRLNVMQSVLGSVSYPLGAGIVIPEEGPVRLRARVRYDVLQFGYQAGDQDQWLEQRYDYAVLSDDYAIARNHWRFTGAFVGLCCQDFYDHTAYADFDDFTYRED